MMLAGFVFMMACNPAREAGIRDRAGEELTEFRNWVSNTVSRADDATEEERASLRQEFSQLSSNMAEGLNDLADDARAEFNQLTARYEEWDAEQDRKMAQQQQQRSDTASDMDQQSQEQWTNKLMGTDYQNINSLMASQIREAYISFMQNVRDNREGWTEQEWEQVEEVLNQLNNRKEQVESALSTEDQAKILALQAEFQTLQTAQEIKEEIKN